MELTPSQIQKGIDLIRHNIIQLLHAFQANHQDEFGSKYLPVLYGSVVREQLHRRHVSVANSLSRHSDLDIFIPQSEVDVKVRDAFRAYLQVNTDSVFEMTFQHLGPSQYTNAHVTRLVFDDKHPLLKEGGIRLVVDLVLQKGVMYPDFTCNQLCVDPSGKLSVMELSTRHSWVTSQRIAKFLHPSFHRFQQCSVFPTATRLDPTSMLVSQIQYKIAHVLLYSPEQWVDLFQPECALQYLQYVRRICIQRSRKLLRTGWKIHGIMHGTKMHVGSLTLRCHNCAEYNLPKSYAIFLGSRNRQYVKYNWVLRLDGERAQKVNEGDVFPYEIFATEAYTQEDDEEVSSTSEDEPSSTSEDDPPSAPEDYKPADTSASKPADNADTSNAAHDSKQNTTPTGNHETFPDNHAALENGTDSVCKLQIKRSTLLVTCGSCGYRGPFCKDFI
jgi:hypothetical protein